MKYLVDSDWVADYLKGRAAAVSLLQSLAPDGFAISILTYGEIYEGILFGSERRRHEIGFSNFLRVADVLHSIEASCGDLPNCAARCASKVNSSVTSTY